MNTNDMRKVASEANRLSEERKRNQQLIANQMANERVDMNKESMSALNNLLKDTSGSASTHFHNFIEENFKDEIERELSPDEVKEIEEQARENINKRNDIPLEQKEEEYEKEKAKLLGDKESENSEVIEQLLKERIVDHPEDAGSVLGKEGAAALQEQLENIKDKRDRAVVEVRDVNSSHYGRICPIESPEGANIGLITSLANYAKVNEYGFIMTPYRRVKDGKLQDQIDYLTADEENGHIIAQAHVEMNDGEIIEEHCPARQD